MFRTDSGGEGSVSRGMKSNVVTNAWPSYFKWRRTLRSGTVQEYAPFGGHFSSIIHDMEVETIKLQCNSTTRALWHRTGEERV